MLVEGPLSLQGASVDALARRYRPSPHSGLPDVVYIGYMRSGSTYLRSYFSIHPQIQWTRKAWYFQVGRDDGERRATYPRFFQSLTPRGCLIDVYEALCLGQYFKDPPSDPDLGSEHPEWSPEWAMRVGSRFSAGPIAVDPAEIARRIKHCVPAARVLIVLRNQVDWLGSMFVHYLSHLPKKSRRFIDFLTTLEGKSAIDGGLYDATLRVYFGVFGRARVHVLLLEQLARQEEPALRRLCDFLGVDYFPHNHAAANRNAGRGDAVSAARGRLLGLLHAFRLRELGVLTERERSMVRSFYSASNLRTAELLGVDLAEYGYAC